MKAFKITFETKGYLEITAETEEEAREIFESGETIEMNDILEGVREFVINEYPEIEEIEEY